MTVLLTSIVALAAPSTASALADDDWLGVVNTYRAMSGLSPVSANATWSAQARDHSCYMLLNGISHDEVPGKPGYTDGGDIAGNSGNVAVSSSISATPRSHIDLWMTGPFHAIGILRHNLASTGFGLCTNPNPPTPWQSGGTLDVIRGIDNSRPRPNTAITFPGNGATVPLTSFITEYPNPMDLCGWSGDAGLPLIAMLPSKVSSAASSISGPNGPVATCTLHPGNTGANGTARAILDGDNAVVVMPRSTLVAGDYTVNVNSNGGNVSWTFTVDPGAGLSVEPVSVPDTEPTATSANFEAVAPFRLVDTRKGQGTTRLRAGRSVKITAAGNDVTAISANFVAANPAAAGHLTVYNCTSDVPEVSTLGYSPYSGGATANQAIVPLSKGSFCIYSHADVDLVIDVNGYYRNSTTASEFQPVTPKRLYDSRTIANGRLTAGVERPVQIAGISGGAPADATAVALNVTAINGADAGHLQVYPCGSTSSLETSTINYRAGEARPNTVVVGADGSGQICLKSLRNLDVAIDMTGYFAPGAGYALTALDPIRLFDSRQAFSRLNESTSGNRVRAGQVIRLKIAGERGIPADAKAASVNLTVTQSSDWLHVTAYPCGTRPETSNLNVAPGQAVANGAMVKLSSTGELCVYVLKDAHLIVDINGVWS